MKSTGIFLLGCLLSAFLLCGCHDDVYDPNAIGENYFIQNIPADFDWATTSGVEAEIIPADLYNGRYQYTLEIFGENPLTETSSVLYGTGWGNGKTPFSQTLVLPATQEEVYIVQTTPGGHRSVKKATIKDKSFYCNFSQEAPDTAPRTQAVKAQNTDIPRQVPAGAIEISGSENITLRTGHNYVIRGVYNGRLTFAPEGNSSLYITGTWKIPSGRTVLEQNSNIYLLETGKLLCKSDCTLEWNASDGILAIGPQAQLGTDDDDDITLIFHNHGKILNEGKLYCEKIKCSPNGMYIENKGKLFADKLTSAGVAYTFRNECYAEIEQLELSNGSLLYIAPFCALECEHLTITNATVQLDNLALLKIEDKLQNAEWGTSVIEGIGQQYAMVETERLIGPSVYAPLNFRSRLYIRCEKYPHKNSYIIDTDCIVENPENSTALEIQPSECTPGTDYIPEKPEEPEFPKKVVYTQCYTYASEDNFPSPGDYDMNDLVLSLDSVGYNYIDKDHVDRLHLHLTLRAVGATRRLGAAIQLDELDPQKIKSVNYSADLPLSYFNVNANQTEQKQEYAVIPLFDNAHRLLGYDNTTTMINTFTGGTRAVPYSFEVTVGFGSPVKSSEIGLDKFNYFTIVGTQLPRTEIHLPGYDHTRLSSTPEEQQEVTKQYMWNIRVPGIFRYPQEMKRITEAYPGFEEWVRSSGKTNREWYEEPDENLIYKQ